jgi:2-hydroxychromene-2-carboxylate isomerase
VSQPVFYYDLASPEAYLLAERVHSVLGEVPEWEPVRIGGVAAAGGAARELVPLAGPGGFRCAEEAEIYRADIERQAAQHGLQPIRWPEPFPADTDWAMLVATYAKQIGRAVAFSLAAFRQAFAAGRDLGARESVLIAAAACEMHPAAVVKGAELRATRERLAAATAAATAAGVRAVPAVRVGDEIVHEP